MGLILFLVMWGYVVSRLKRRGGGDKLSRCINKSFLTPFVTSCFHCCHVSCQIIFPFSLSKSPDGGKKKKMKGVFLCSGGRVKTPTASKTKKKAVLSRDQCHALKKIVNVAGTTEQVLP